jgi:predicted phage terminase large subunit-like protein
MLLTEEDWRNIEREECKSLSYFVQRAWKSLEPSQPYMHGWHIDAIAEHLEAVTKGQINRLLINIPPGTMKSMMVGVLWPAWEWGPMGLSSKRVIGASHEAKLATRDNLHTRRLISSDWYQALWPIVLTTDQNEKTFFQNTATGWRQSCAVTSMTGRRGDSVIWDDPHSVEDAYSDAALEAATRIFRETLPTRLNNPDKSAIIIIMQRLAENDVSGEILCGDFGYVHLMLPMEYEPGRKCKTSIGFTDPRTEEGELLFPARFSREVVERDKKIMGSHAVAGQFQQRPNPLGGGLIKGAWFGRFDEQPDWKRHKTRAIFADTAMKTGERNDFTVFVDALLCDDGKIYMLNLWRRKVDAVGLLSMARDIWASTEGKASAMYIEDKASGTGLIQQLQQTGQFVPVIPVQRTKDKLTRLMEVQPKLQAGAVMLPNNAPWVADFIAECESFTADDSHAHDDQIDPLIDAINILASSVDWSIWS